MTMKILAVLLVLLSVASAQLTTQVPSDFPSSAPSTEPTVAASDESDSPSSTPTVTASSSPSMTASAEPSATATTSPPVVMVTEMPSDSPSSAPAAAFSEAPSDFPSSSPVAASAMPSDSPSSAPVAPSAMPSDSPSSAPVAMVSQAPSTLPSYAPSGTPSSLPSTGPSSDPTTSPTAAETPTFFTPLPTPQPTAPPTTQSTPSGTEVSVTERITLVITQVTGEPSSETAVTGAVVQAFQNFFAGRRRLRKLQTVDDVTSFSNSAVPISQTFENGSLTSTYDHTVTYTAPEAVDDIFTAPFESATFLADLDSLLKESDSVFADVEADNDFSAAVAPPEEGDSGGLSGGAIGGIIVAAVVGVGAAGYLLYRNSGSGGDGYQSANEPPRRVSASNDDVSAIGAAPSGGYGDQSVATMDYDYSKAYGGADTSVVSSAGGTLGENTRLTSEVPGTSRTALGAASFESGTNTKEEVIEIQAPAGKLGVVIDTPNDGPPIVHAVKDSSVIADLIQVGDKLIAVDDDDVTAMTAIKVSKLISKKSANPSRKLTVIRTSIAEDA